MTRTPGKLPELLAPAGSLQALKAAIEGGADAVYLGGIAFNARLHARNFTPEELAEGIGCAHAFGARVYVTANTLVWDRELDDFLRAAEVAYLCGADALIVADIGAAEEIRRRIPIELHASTQLSGHSTETARLLEKAGFSRMVCAREMSREDLRRFVRNSPIEAEVFVHGALCVCHSGQCLFSSVVGGRSGNRGECAQPCRLPYRTTGGKVGYPLSLKDLCLAPYVPELIDMGIASLKIEGRMKSPEYVRDVTRIWRRLLDEHRGADDAEMQELARIFSRDDFTAGYYTGKIDRKMLGVRSDDSKKSSRELEPFDRITRKRPIALAAEIRSGVPMRLTATPLWQGGKAVTVEGDIPAPALTAPLSREAAERSLTKFGATPYEVKRFEADLEEGLMVPVSSLNALRRAASEALAPKENRTEQDFTPCREKEAPAGHRTPMKTAAFYDPDTVVPEAREFFDRIWVPLERYDGSCDGILLPPVIFDGEEETIGKMLEEAYRLGARHALISNPAQIALARSSGFTLHGDLRLNIANRPSARFYEELGLEDYILSPELNPAQMRDIGGKSFAVVYGRLPLMITEKCVGRELAGCSACREGKNELTDRRGVRFPVLRTFRHRSLIFNSVPLYMADREEELVRAGLSMRHFIFTTETPAQVRDVIRAYRNHTPPKGDIRRMG